MKLTIEINGETYTLDLPDETARGLEEIANRNGLSLEGALQQAITNENFLERLRESGAKLLVEKGDKLNELELA